MDNFLWDGMAMPNTPYDQHQRDTGRNHPTPAARERFPAQPRYRSARSGHHAAGLWSWAELDALPAGESARRGLGAR
jgi:hypothetical protein